MHACIYVQYLYICYVVISSDKYYYGVCIHVCMNGKISSVYVCMGMYVCMYVCMFVDFQTGIYNIYNGMYVYITLYV